MTDEDRPSTPADESGEEWVTLGSFWSTRRAPGIDEVQETTYLAPPARIARRTLIVGTVIALGSVAIGAALVFAAGSSGDGGGGESELSAAATLTSSSTTTSSTTSTTSPPTTTTNPTPSTTAAKAVVPASSSTPPAPTPPTPRATADVSQAVYQPVPLPAGVTASLTSCTWQPNGQLQTAGTITSTATVGRTWTMTMHWLQNHRTIAQQSGLMDLLPGQSKPWSLTIAQPNAPADLACSLAIT